MVERINELKWAKEITAERMQGLMEEQELGGGGDVLNERGRNYSKKSRVKGPLLTVLEVLPLTSSALLEKQPVGR